MLVWAETWIFVHVEPDASIFGSTKRFLGLGSENDAAICVLSHFAGGKQTRPRSLGASSGIGNTDSSSSSSR